MVNNPFAMKNPNSKLYAQGDIILRPVPKLPEGKRKPTEKNSRGFVLAHGEVTGHAHVLLDSPDVEVVDIEGVSYADIKNAMATLVHDEHATIELPAGKYEIVRQREYTPTKIRRVAD